MSCTCGREAAELKTARLSGKKRMGLSRRPAGEIEQEITALTGSERNNENRRNAVAHSDLSRNRNEKHASWLKSGKNTGTRGQGLPGTPHMSGLNQIPPVEEHRAEKNKDLWQEPESGRAHRPEGKNV
jgi:hypothetical protein